MSSFIIPIKRYVRSLLQTLPAFPSDGFGGMSELEYLAAHAPAVPDEWDPDYLDDDRPEATPSPEWMQSSEPQARVLREAWGQYTEHGEIKGLPQPVAAFAVQCDLERKIKEEWRQRRIARRAAAWAITWALETAKAMQWATESASKQLSTESAGK